jgi:sterol desaturase/sphingolipid hydroxylase (fatty acid hydroxylase superfamily)
MSLFGAPPIPMEDVYALEANAPDLIVYAVPVMLFFTLLEYGVSFWQNRRYYDNRELMGSIGVGLGNLVVSGLLKTILIFFVIWLYNQLPWRMSLNWWTFIPCYVFYDFCSYWAHRISHEQRFWWATHVAHHSGEYYNLAVSFRLSWVQHLKIIFMLPSLLVGFHPIIYFITNQIAVLFQFWVHTEYIRKLHPAIEFIFATPSNHRVHHGSQDEYLDKNYGATFIIWDRMFGTYQKEEAPVKYGLTTPISNKANPFYINFHEYMDMWKDVKAAKSWRKKLYYIFGSPAEIAKEKAKAYQAHG